MSEPIDHHDFNDIIQWSSAYLSLHGYTFKNRIPENVQTTPWSCVLKFETSKGNIYLKQTPKLIALESVIIKTLHGQFHAPVPEIIADNPELHCFLMKDEGQPLRGILKKHFDLVLICKAINQFTSLQLTVANNVDILPHVGVPDWRLDKLPHLFEQLLLEKEILIEDGLSEKETEKLQSLIPTVSDLCKKLSAFDIKETLVQPDFNDNNTLIDNVTQKITIIDLGEIVISHPFFSLLNFLFQMKKHHGVTEEDNRYQSMLDACFKNFITNKSKEILLNAFELAQKLFRIYGALAHYRLMLACDKTKLNSFYGRGKLSSQLKEFLLLCKK